MYVDVLKKGNLLSHSKFTIIRVYAEFSEICHIFITLFVILNLVRPDNDLPVLVRIVRFHKDKGIKSTVYRRSVGLLFDSLPRFVLNI